MLNSELIAFFEEELSKTLGLEIKIDEAHTLHGGSINYTYCLVANQQNFLAKLNQNQPKDFFLQESLGLKALSYKSGIYIPKVYLEGVRQNIQYLVMEFVQEGMPQQKSWEAFGTQLAQLHQNTSAYFGWEQNNYIGSLPQLNKTHSKWIDFFIECRLQHQAALAIEQKRIELSLVKQLEQLYLKLPSLIPEESPALLHGDLWSGNYLVSNNQDSVLIDPAVYYGHREVDLAMMHLFGGFPKSVFESYHDTFPLEKNWESRIDLFNLYPLMVHVNLFGESYAKRVSRILQKYLK